MTTSPTAEPEQDSNSADPRRSGPVSGWVEHWTSYPQGCLRLARAGLTLLTVAVAVPTCALALVLTDMCQDHEYWERFGLSAEGAGLGGVVGGVNAAGWVVLVGVIWTVVVIVFS